MDSLKAILYFSIFRYPLKLEEIHGYTNNKTLQETKDDIHFLIEKEVIGNVDNFYVYNNDNESVAKRVKGNNQAEKALVIAKERASFIAKFPFVKGVGVSGSLSKGYYDSDSDIDFFIITQHSKLWICRTFLMVYKKLFLFNSRQFFCINYYVSENQLEIEEKNIFTATELKTLIPLEGSMVFEKFYEKNNWIASFFSNFEVNLDEVQDAKKLWFTKTIELILLSRFGIFLNATFKSITLKKWNAKFHYLNPKDFEIAMKSSENISKHHPSNFQKKVVDSLNEKIEEVKIKFAIEIPKEHV